MNYSALYEKDHFNQTQAEFKKEANGQSKQVAQKKRVEKRSVCTMHSGTSLVHTLQKMDHLRPSISLLLQLSVYGLVEHRMRRYHAMSVSRGRVAAKAYSIAWSLSPILRLMPHRDANETNTIGKLTLQRA